MGISSLHPVPLGRRSFHLRRGCVSRDRRGNLIALDARTGEALWHFQTGAPITSSPLSYAVNGKQFVAVSAGNVLYSFALPE
jgi:alcohol dehydrogenase (cytochrome c)